LTTIAKTVAAWIASKARRRSVPRVSGRRGERFAARHLRRRGYRILARNLATRHGELDLVALSPDRHALVVVEVKAGRAGAAIAPEVHVTPAKQRKIVALAAELVRRRRLSKRPIRFDVVAVAFDGDRPVDLRHHEAAFESHV
jgi:putative endonuclease